MWVKIHHLDCLFLTLNLVRNRFWWTVKKVKVYVAFIQNPTHAQNPLAYRTRGLRMVDCSQTLLTICGTVAKRVKCLTDVNINLTSADKWNVKHVQSSLTPCMQKHAGLTRLQLLAIQHIGCVKAQTLLNPLFHYLTKKSVLRPCFYYHTGPPEEQKHIWCAAFRAR